MSQTIGASGTATIEDVMPDDTKEKIKDRGIDPDKFDVEEEPALNGDLPDVQRQQTEELTNYLTDVERATNDDGTITGEVEWVGSPERNEQIVMLVNVPSEADPVRFFFDKPRTWDKNKYMFVRFAEAKGYGPTAITAMNEDRVRVEVIREEDDYALNIPDSRSLLARAKERGSVSVDYTLARDKFLATVTSTNVLATVAFIEMSGFPAVVGGQLITIIAAGMFTLLAWWVGYLLIGIVLFMLADILGVLPDEY